MKIPVYARYDYSVKRSCEFLEEFSISQFPVNPFEIINSNNWGLLTYSEMAKEYNCTIDDVINSVKSKDARTIYNGNNYTIAYNDFKPKRRILFTLMHEIGHIYLNHLVDFENTEVHRGGLSNDENKVLENEANTFARNTLAPATFVELLNEKSKKAISKYFGLSYLAAQTRLDFLDYDKQYVNQSGIQSRLHRIFYKFYYRYGCKKCNAIIIIKDASYCPICGEKRLKWGDGKMYYKKYNTYENSNKLRVCLICDNEETDMNGDYCHICGKPLANRCDDRNWEYNDSYGDKPCGKPVPSNARFCPYCGSTTTFFNENILEDWKAEHDKINSGYMNIPDDDEGLPFN